MPLGASRVQIAEILRRPGPGDRATAEIGLPDAGISDVDTTSRRDTQRLRDFTRTELYHGASQRMCHVDRTPFFAHRLWQNDLIHRGLMILPRAFAYKIDT